MLASLLQKLEIGSQEVPEKGECSLKVPRHASASSDFVPRIIPAPDDQGLALVWQDGDALFLQRFDRNCRGATPLLEVNSTRDFWRQPGASGLQDAAGLPGGSTVVTWTLGGTVWSRIMRADGQNNSPSRVSSPAYHERTEVRVAANPDDGSFAIIWQSWNQDGDGWGIFARPYAADGTPLAEELQVNVGWRGFQWHPQLTWCKNSLWAIWANTGQSCLGELPLGASGCSQGPVVRRLIEAGDWRLAEEVYLEDGMPLTAALACASSGIDGDAVVALWMQQGGREVRWEYIRAEGAFKIQILSRLFMNRRLDLRPTAPDQLRGTATAIARDVEVQEKLPEAIQSYKQLQALEEASKGALDFGQVEMLAHGGVMTLLTKHRSGTLGAQLIQYVSSNPVAFSRRMIALSAQSGSAAWDDHDEHLALISCWATGGSFEADEPSAFACARHTVGWLTGSDFDRFAATATASAMAAVMCLSMALWSVSRLTRCVGLRLWASARQGRARRRGTSSTRHRRLLEVRRQLSLIPDTPPNADPAHANDGDMHSEDFQDTGAGSSEACQTQLVAHDESEADVTDDDVEVPEAVYSRPYDRDACPICQENVGVWVALRPCGHTACRKCTLRIAETSQRCHMCRAHIKGVQPVYI